MPIAMALMEIRVGCLAIRASCARLEAYFAIPRAAMDGVEVFRRMVFVSFWKFAGEFWKSVRVDYGDTIPFGKHDGEIPRDCAASTVFFAVLVD